METLVDDIEQTEAAAGTLVDSWSHENIFIRLGICIAILIVMVLLMRLVTYLFKKQHNLQDLFCTDKLKLLDDDGLE